MRKSKRTESGQAAVLLALMFIGLLAFAALAIDGGNAYLVRRNAQNAVDAAAVAGAREVYSIIVGKPEDIPSGYGAEEWLQKVINDIAERNGVPDPEVLTDTLGTVNSHVTAWYLDENGELVTWGEGFWEVGGTGTPGIPSDARGIKAEVTIPFNTFLAGLVGRHQMAATARADAVNSERFALRGNAIWADGDCGLNTTHIAGSSNRITGGVHSNSGLHIGGGGGGGNYYTGTVEFNPDEASTVTDNTIFIPAENNPSHEEPRPMPQLFFLDDFRPGGDYANYGAYYYYPGSVSFDLDAGELPDGLHFAEGGFKIHGGDPEELRTVTLVTPGDINIQSTTAWFRPYVPFLQVEEVADHGQLLIFTTFRGWNEENKCNDLALSMSSSTLNWEGLVYAPNGQVNQSGSGNLSLFGSIVAWSVDLSGSDIEITYNPDYDPPPPPRIIIKE